MHVSQIFLKKTIFCVTYTLASSATKTGAGIGGNLRISAYFLSHETESMSICLSLGKGRENDERREIAHKCCVQQKKYVAVAAFDCWPRSTVLSPYYLHSCSSIQVTNSIPTIPHKYSLTLSSRFSQNRESQRLIYYRNKRDSSPMEQERACL